MTVLIVGQSVRAAAESAVRSGLDVWGADAFADADGAPGVRMRPRPRRFTPRSIERATRSLTADAVVYLSPFENHAGTVGALASRRMLWGNPPEVIRRIRDPRRLHRVLRDNGFAVPEGSRWLVKPLRSGGGNGVRPWRPGERVPRGSYRQPYADGDCWSVSFAASAAGVVVLGLSRQLVGDPAFGADGFRHCGNVLEPAPAGLARRCAALARVIAAEFGLRGVNGIDFIRQGDEPVAIEVNPRWSSSMELLEERLPSPVFAIHVEACTTGRLPDVPAAGGPVTGKAIVFARHGVRVGDNRAWLADGEVRDVPHRGDYIAGGAPVCTVLASAADAPSCQAGLVDKASDVYEQLERWRRSVA
jgi:predicted ATP-grasp superfamily ATP-dependent carboligase